MASSMAVPRATSQTSGRLKANLPVIEHPMAKLGNKSELTIRGSSSLSIRRENTVVTVNKGHVELGLQGSPIKKEVRDETPSYVVRKSAPERILQWPPEYIQGPRRSIPKKTEVSVQYVSRSPLELSDMIKEKLASGYHGLRHLFKANDPTGQGSVSREALMRILVSLCGYISSDQYTRFLKKFSLDGKDVISFDSFVTCFKENESVKKEWVSPVQRLAVEDTFMAHKPEENLRRSDVVFHDPYTSAPFADKIFRDKIRSIEDLHKVLPPACFEPNGMVVPPQLREAFAQLNIYVTDSEFAGLWQRYDTEGTGAIYTLKLLRKMGIDVARRPKTFHANDIDESSKVKVNRRPHSQIPSTEFVNNVTVKTEVNDKKSSEVKINHEITGENGAVKTEIKTTHKDSHVTSNGVKVQSSQQNRYPSDIQETTLGHDPNKTKVLKAALRKQAPKLENIIDCMHYRFEESYNALSTAFHLFDQMDDGYIARLDFRRVLQEFGLNTSVTDLDYFLSRDVEVKNTTTVEKSVRIGIRSIRGQINYKEFLNKFQSKAENSITTRIVTNQQHLFQHDSVPLQKPSLNAEEMEAGVVTLLHGDFLKLISYFRSCDKYCLGVITPYEFRSGIEKRLGYPMSERQWEQLKADVGQDKDGLIPYTKFLQLFDVSPGSWNKRQEGNIDVAQIAPGDMPQPSAVDRLKEKAKTYMSPRDIVKPRMDDTKTVAEIQKLLEELFKNRIHTFDKHFKEMDRKMMGRMSKWQFGALLKLCGLVLTNSELDKIWATLNVGPDGMYSYSALIKHFIQFKAPLAAAEKRNTSYENTRELVEAAKQVQRERKEQRAKTEIEKTTTTVTHSHSVEVEKTNVKETHQETTVNYQQQPNQVTTTVVATPPSYITNKTPKIKDLLVKCKQDVIGNWEGLKSVFKFIDKGGIASITINEMMDVMSSMKFGLSEEEKKEICQRFDLQRNGRFHYLEFMKCFSQKPENASKSSKPLAYNKYSHKLEHKQDEAFEGEATISRILVAMRTKLMMEHKNLRRAFKKLDIYNRGYLGVGDFKRALSTCKIAVTNEDFYHMLTEFDRTMTGKISYQDFLTTLLSV